MNSKATTVLTNLQRGNVESIQYPDLGSLSFHEKCAQGEISDDEIQYFGNVDQPDLEFGFSAIHWSAFYGQLKTTEKLLELGSNPNVFASNLITPLHLSAAHGHHEIVRALIIKGASVNVMDIEGNTPLHFSAASNFPHSTNEILSCPYVDVMIENAEGKTAYHLAIEKKAYLSVTVLEKFMMNIMS